MGVGVRGSPALLVRAAGKQKKRSDAAGQHVRQHRRFSVVIRPGLRRNASCTISVIRAIREIRASSAIRASSEIRTIRAERRTTTRRQAGTRTETGSRRRLPDPS